MARKYSQIESEFIIAERKRGISYERIALLVNATAESVRHHYEYSQLRSSARWHRRKEQQREYRRKRRQEMKRPERFYNEPVARIDVPDSVWADRDARYAEPRTVSMILLGDPPPSQSELGRRLALGQHQS